MGLKLTSIMYLGVNSFWSYELSKSALSKRGILGTNGTDGDESHTSAALNILLSGGIAGVVTWASIFPLDVIKTRLQTWDLLLAMATLSAKSKDPMHTPLLGDTSDGSLSSSKARAPSSWTIARHAYQTEGMGVFFRGLGVCSVRAFIVNAVQWAVCRLTIHDIFFALDFCPFTQLLPIIHHLVCDSPKLDTDLWIVPDL